MPYTTLPWESLYSGCLTPPYHEKHRTLGALHHPTTTSIAHWVPYNTLPWQALYIGCLTTPYHDKNCNVACLITPYRETYNIGALQHFTMRSIVHLVPYNTLPWEALYIGCLTTLYHEKECNFMCLITPYREAHCTSSALKHLTTRSIVHRVPYNTLPWEALHIGCLTALYHEKDWILGALQHSIMRRIEYWVLYNPFVWEPLYIVCLATLYCEKHCTLGA